MLEVNPSAKQGFIPMNYTGGESVTFPNGLILKQGIESIAQDTTDTVTFAVAFPNAVVTASISKATQSADVYDPGIAEITAAHIKIWNSHSGVLIVHWQVWGY